MPTTSPPIKPDRAAHIVRFSYAEADRFFRDLVAEGEQQGLRVVCREGCAACCAYVVHITPAEAVVLAASVQRLPHPIRRAIVDRLASWEREWMAHAGRHNGDRHATRKETVVAWQVRQIACPLLDPDSRRCLAYKDRPIACRVHHASTTNGTAERMCDSCPDVPAPEACVTTEEHVRCGHAPWVWQLRNDLIRVFGALQITALLDNGGDAFVPPGVLPSLVLEAGRSRYGWRSTRVVELPMVLP